MVHVHVRLQTELVVFAEHQVSNFSSTYHGENKLYLMRWCLLCIRPTGFVGFL